MQKIIMRTPRSILNTIGTQFTYVAGAIISSCTICSHEIIGVMLPCAWSHSVRGQNCNSYITRY